MKNWKTTLAGIVAAVFGFVAASPDLFARWPWLIALAKFATAGGLFALGGAAKDCTTHSTITQVDQASVKKEDA